MATLDLISGGRVEFGTGEFATTGEMGGFNVDPALKREQWREGLEVAVRSRWRRLEPTIEDFAL